MSSTPELGLIEGFFGRPWSWEERRETVSFLAPYGYRFYFYAPKADTYLRKRWQEPHPDSEMQKLAALRAHCRAEGVRFGLGLSPFELHLHADEDWKAPLAAKLDALAELEPEDLAILFDDMRGDIPDLAARQAAIVHFAAEHPVAERLLFCPSYYSDDPILDVAFGQRPQGYLEDLGRLLDPAVGVFWTGEEVCSAEYSPGHLERVAEALRRRPVLWDNYPVNDGARMSQHLHLRGFSGRPASIGSHLAGHAINPASQAVLSRIPALTLAESYRAGDAYQYGAAFERAAEAVLGPALARRVRLDLLVLQDRGRDRLGERVER
ncbi:MAG TPA: beta-N-acetylglucosaminidase domain-containing protein, partial [Allosphingosinicella sp.]